MKKLIYILILLLTVTFFESCDSNDIETPVLTAEDYPRILGRWPDKIDGKLGSFEVAAGDSLSVIMQFTPSHLCEGTWFLDGVEYCKGTTFEYISETPVAHILKLVVKTPKYETTREANLVVSPAP